MTRAFAENTTTPASAMHGAVDVSGSVGVVPNTGIIAVQVGRHGFGQCSEVQRGRPLGQLGRLHQNGEAAPSAHRSAKF